MFGHDHNDQDDQSHQIHTSDNPQTDQTASSAAADDSWQHPSTMLDEDGNPPSDDQPSETHEAAPIEQPETKGPEPLAEDEVQTEEPAESAPETPEEPADVSDHTPIDAGNNDLIDLKQEALTKLSPLVDHLDQSPEEKFRTLMMMIQASDNQELVRQAYEAALNIENEKERAQALLDVVNEINYFTQNPSDKA